MTSVAANNHQRPLGFIARRSFYYALPRQAGTPSHDLTWCSVFAPCIGRLMSRYSVYQTVTLRTGERDFMIHVSTVHLLADALGFGCIAWLLHAALSLGGKYV